LKSRYFKELNVVSKFRKSLKFQQKFGDNLLSPSKFNLSKWPDLVFFIYIYNNTSNCILWYTEISTRNKWHWKDFFRYSIFKVVMIGILKVYIFLQSFAGDVLHLKYFFIGLCTYLFSLVEVEFMKEDLILEKNLAFNQSINQSIDKIKLKEKVRFSIESVSKIFQKSKSLKVIEKTKKRFTENKSKSIERKIKQK
jgi:hypothetical protein